MNEDLKGLYAAIVLSAFVVLGMNYFFPKPTKQTTTTAEEVVITPAIDANSVDETADKAEEKSLLTAEILPQDARLPIKNAVLQGSVRLKGARLDNLLLTKYRETIEPESQNVTLLAPSKTAEAYFAEYGWLSTDKSLNLPNADTLWKAEGNTELTPQTSVTLVWENGQGLKFVNKLTLDENYLFGLEQTVENNSGRAVTLLPYGLFSKSIDESSKSRGVVHEGFVGVLNGKLKEIRYSDMKENPQEFTTTGGWVSFADKYWFGSFVFADNADTRVNLRKVKNGVYQLDYKGTPLQLQTGESTTINTKLYAGAKEIKLLDKYAENIKKFDLNIDFGWYYFLTKPFFYILDFLYGLIGNMGWAILLFAAILRLSMFPLAHKSYDNMSKMKKVQPKIMALQAMYKDDKMALQRATMELYKREKVNPAAGCLPMFLQIPIFFSLFKVLNIAIEIRHAPFIGWVKDLSAPDPLTISTWAHIYIPSAIDIGVWPLIYGLTMFIQNQLNPKPANKDQARMFALMPILFTIMFAHFAVGLVIYWILNNILSLIQQKIIMYKNGVK
ncbi:MAG: membrane protein insertase YidC [Alphaproteobacteria bacterium]|nr:membrane protein insertase YidC [Alphaproteobacteria bacterium]